MSLIGGPQRHTLQVRDKPRFLANNGWSFTGQVVSRIISTRLCLYRREASQHFTVTFTNYGKDHSWEKTVHSFMAEVNHPCHLRNTQTFLIYGSYTGSTVKWTKKNEWTSARIPLAIDFFALLKWVARSRNKMLNVLRNICMSKAMMDDVWRRHMRHSEEQSRHSRWRS